MEMMDVNEEDGNELMQNEMRKMQELIGGVKREKTSTQKDYPNVPITVEDATFDRTVQQYPLVIIDCWAPWCGPCWVVAPVIDELAKDYAGKVVFGKLNVDENPKIATRFGILGIPTLLILRNGKEADRIIGAVPKQYIEAKLQRYL